MTPVILLVRGHAFMKSSRWREGGELKDGQNSDGSGWLQGEGEGNRMSRAIISIGVIRVQTVFQTGVWFCYKCS